MHGCFLSKPSEAYRDSYLQALREFHAESRNLKYDIERVSEDFGAFVRSLHEQSDRSKLAEGIVLATILWLIEKDEFIGRVSIRHELNEQLLVVGGHIGYEIRPS